jgi:two-component system, LytTR family, response regulator
MKYRCLIIDDEPLAIDVIADYVKSIESLELVDVCRSATEAFQIMQKEQIDLVFLDIMMPEISGMAFAKSLINPPKIIFTTASAEFAAESYETNTIDYLIKPIGYDRFLKAIQRFLSSTPNKPISGEGSDGNNVFIKSENKVYKVPTHRITYIESYKDYILIHRQDESTITSYQTISNFQKVLNDATFIRVHRSFIINLDHVTAYDASTIEIGNTAIPIGRTYKEQVKVYLKS